MWFSWDMCRSIIMGRKEMRAEVVQTRHTKIGTDVLVIHCVYCKGSLILMYRSRAIMQRLRMEAVEHITSLLQ